MSVNALLFLRRQRIIRAGIGLMVLAGAAFASYKLTHVPQPVKVETIADFSPASIKLGQEEFVIEGPVVTEGILFSHNGRQNETVNVSFDRARLDQQTLQNFASLRLKPPPTLTEIDYRALESNTVAAGHEPCHTRVELLAAQLPAEIEIFQLGDPGQNHYRHFQMRASGAELRSKFLTTSPDESNLAPGCQYSLNVGDWSQPLSRILVGTNVAEHATVSFYFKPLTPAASPWADMGGFLPLDLGAQKLNPTDPSGFQARAISIRALGVSNSPDRLSARSLDEGPLLTISDLKIDSNQIQLSVVGKGSVRLDGQVVTVDFLKFVKENQILSAALIAANAALLAWVGRLIFKTPQTPGTPGK